MSRAIIFYLLSRGTVVITIIVTGGKSVCDSNFSAVDLWRNHGKVMQRKRAFGTSCALIHMYVHVINISAISYVSLII